ncbi:ATP-binding protein [Thermotoga sp.]|uniref:ATP-binding protein n=1 Tax=Thermotoga sp. TaxID=28240 RepID=UPI0025F31AF4|nr:ATP-binding protein [Thermotoga sp.]MCD6550908.1 ATP-binding protein [Thermotoga sp.]
MIITVLSGKGGTGKTTVATNLAWVLSQSRKVQLLDADVEEPNDHLFLPPQIEETEPVEMLLPQVDQKACIKCGKCAKVCQFGAISVFKTGVMVFDSLCHGCGACALVCPKNAITEVPKAIGEVKSGKVHERINFSMGILNIGEPSGVKVIRKLKEKIDPSADIVIVDAPPGTSCPVVEALRGSDFALLVTEPTPFGLHDLQMAVELVSEMGIKAGIVVNRDSRGYESVERFSEESDIPILMRIPYDPQIAELYSRGILFSSHLPQWKVEFERLFEKIREMVEA